MKPADTKVGDIVYLNGSPRLVTSIRKSTNEHFWHFEYEGGSTIEFHTKDLQVGVAE